MELYTAVVIKAPLNDLTAILIFAIYYNSRLHVL
uniref:Uncharacterized protein n=1 Tax=Arundo donax TaxID=35708 RepID=A0A0A9AXL0_ARUDO